MTTKPSDEFLTPEYLNSLVELDEAIRERDATDNCSTVEFGTDLWKVHRLLLNLKTLYEPQQPVRKPFPLNHPERMGRYRLLQILGAGGFAVVYLGQDQYLGRRVAVKVLRPHALASVDLRQRFIREGQAAALLDHPNIVATYEAGEEDDIPYIAYAYCEGSTLSAWIKRQAEPPSPRTAAEIVRTLADAVQYSHDRGILHRDIKPGNVLLQPRQPTDDGSFPFVAKLSDYGLAKLIEVDLQDTVTGVMLGTPRYMAPEQTKSRCVNVGAPTDVYGLGCVLYELLTAQPPFTAETPWDVLAQVRDYPPAAPRLIRPQIPRDLETIVLTCLAKDPADRYATAAELSNDLDRFLNGDEIRARPESLVRQLWLWYQHRKAIAILSAVALFMGLLLVVGSLVYSWRVTQFDKVLASHNEQLTRTVKQLDSALTMGRESQVLAERRARDLSRVLYSIEMTRAAEAWKRGDVQAMAAALQPLSQPIQGEGDLREFGWKYLWQQQALHELFRAKLPSRQYAATFSADGKSVAFAGADSIVRRYSLDDFRLLQQIPTEQREINAILFDTDGKWLATAGDDGTVAMWDIETGSRTAVWHLFDEQAYHIALVAPMNAMLACGNAPDVHLLNLATGARAGVLTGSHSKAVESLSVSPDGSLALTCGADRIAVIWDLESRTPLHRIGGFDYFVSSGAWTPDGRYVAVGALDNRLRIFDVQTGQIISDRQLLDPVQSVAISPKGLLLAGDRAGAVTVFRLDSFQQNSAQEPAPVARWALHKHRVYGLATNSDSGLFATASRDQEVAVFQPQIHDQICRRAPVVHGGRYATRKTVGPDRSGRFYRLAAKGIEVLERKDASPSEVVAEDYRFLDLSWKYDTLLAADADGQLFHWNTAETRLSSPEVTDVYPGDGIGRIVPLDEHRVLLQRVLRLSGQTGVGLWNMRTLQFEKMWLHQHNVALSRNGRHFVMADNAEHRLAVFDAKTMSEICSAVGHTESINGIVFGRDDLKFYTASTDRTIRVWETATLKELSQLRGHETHVRSVAVSPDEKTLASCDDSGSLRLWDLRTGRELYELYRHNRVFNWLEFSPDGEELLGIDQELAEFRWSCGTPALQK